MVKSNVVINPSAEQWEAIFEAQHAAGENAWHNIPNSQLEYMLQQARIEGAERQLKADLQRETLTNTFNRQGSLLAQYAASIESMFLIAERQADGHFTATSLERLRIALSGARGKFFEYWAELRAAANALGILGKPGWLHYTHVVQEYAKGLDLFTKGPQAGGDDGDYFQEVSKTYSTGNLHDLHTSLEKVITDDSTIYLLSASADVHTMLKQWANDLLEAKPALRNHPARLGRELEKWLQQRIDQGQSKALYAAALEVLTLTRRNGAVKRRRGAALGNFVGQLIK